MTTLPEFKISDKDSQLSEYKVSDEEFYMKDESWIKVSRAKLERKMKESAYRPPTMVVTNRPGWTREDRTKELNELLAENVSLKAQINASIAGLKTKLDKNRRRIYRLKVLLGSTLSGQE